MTKDEALKQARRMGKQGLTEAFLEALAQPVQEPVAQEKPHAQVLVDWFDEANGFSHGTKAPHKWVLQAQEELRRSLHPTAPLPVRPPRPWAGLDHDELIERANQEECASVFSKGAIWGAARLREKNA